MEDKRGHKKRLGVAGSVRENSPGGVTRRKTVNVRQLRSGGKRNLDTDLHPKFHLEIADEKILKTDKDFDDGRSRSLVDCL